MQIRLPEPCGHRQDKGNNNARIMPASRQIYKYQCLITSINIECTRYRNISLHHKVFRQHGRRATKWQPTNSGNSQSNRDVSGCLKKNRRYSNRRFCLSQQMQRVMLRCPDFPAHRPQHWRRGGYGGSSNLYRQESGDRQSRFLSGRANRRVCP